MTPNFKLIYSDSDLMVIDKDPGLVVTPTLTQHSTTVSEILQTEYGIELDRGGIVHRLDKDTSGLMVVAKTQAALEHLQAQFKDRTIDKEYLALVHGAIPESGTVDAPIERNPGDREKFIVTDTGKVATTEYTRLQTLQFKPGVLESLFADYPKIAMRKLEKTNYSLFSMVSVHPLTGRTHQIRVHFKYIGHPIVGDEKYAGRKTARMDHRFCTRQFLHAHRLKFTHPVTGEVLEFYSELAADLSQVLLNLIEINV